MSDYFLFFISSFVLYPEIFDDLIEHINYFTYMMVAFSTGIVIHSTSRVTVTKYSLTKNLCCYL